jgi:hypothetical protein
MRKVIKLATFGDDDLTRFLQVVNSNQIANLANFPEPYSLMRRVNDCFSTAGKHLINPEPVTTGILFLRSQYAYKTTVGMALAGQVVEAFVMMRSCLEYAGYALVMFDNPASEDVFFSRHLGDATMKGVQKREFLICNVRDKIATFDRKLAVLFQEFYDHAIDLGGHPNPLAVCNAVQMESSGSGHTFRTLALSKDEITLRHAMKSTAEVGLTALFIFQHIFKAKFELLGLGAELDSLRQSNL